MEVRCLEFLNASLNLSCRRIRYSVDPRYHKSICYAAGWSCWSRGMSRQGCLRTFLSLFRVLDFAFACTPKRPLIASQSRQNLRFGGVA